MLLKKEHLKSWRVAKSYISVQHSTHQQHIRRNKRLQIWPKLSSIPIYTFLLRHETLSPQEKRKIEEFSWSTPACCCWQFSSAVSATVWTLQRYSRESYGVGLLYPFYPRYMPTMMIFQFHFMISIVICWPLRVIVQVRVTFAKMICLIIVKGSYCFFPSRYGDSFVCRNSPYFIVYLKNEFHLKIESCSFLRYVIFNWL